MQLIQIYSSFVMLIYGNEIPPAKALRLVRGSAIDFVQGQLVQMGDLGPAVHAQGLRPIRIPAEAIDAGVENIAAARLLQRQLLSAAVDAVEHAAMRDYGYARRIAGVQYRQQGM